MKEELKDFLKDITSTKKMTINIMGGLAIMFYMIFFTKNEIGIISLIVSFIVGYIYANALVKEMNVIQFKKLKFLIALGIILLGTVFIFR
jgi:hypothetical protein